MKTKNSIIKILPFLFLLLSFNAFADTVFIKTPEIHGKITVPQTLTLTDWQAVMSCHFDAGGDRKESVRYPQTILKNTGAGEYSLFIKKGSLSEFLPSWRLLTCAYKMIIIGKDSVLGRSFLGEIYFLGQEHGEMDPQDLKDMQNKEFIAKVLNEKLSDLKLVISPEGAIVVE